MMLVDAYHFNNMSGRRNPFLRFQSARRGNMRTADVQQQESRYVSTLPPIDTRLREIQQAISEISMHLPTGFALGLKRQFATMMAPDAWEDSDALPTMMALDLFLKLLIGGPWTRKPGVGTNGRGSITAFWVNGKNRLSVDCTADGEARWIVTRVYDDGTIERAAGECAPERVSDMIQPYHPEVWFD